MIGRETREVMGLVLIEPKYAMGATDTFRYCATDCTCINGDGDCRYFSEGGEYKKRPAECEEAQMWFAQIRDAEDTLHAALTGILS